MKPARSGLRKCAMMSTASVVGKIQELGIEVEHNPRGCTGLCPPIDVGVNKLFKNRIRQQWESGMIQEGIVHGTTSPHQEKIFRSGHLLQCVETLPDQIVKNVWRHDNYTWFPDEMNNTTNSTSPLLFIHCS